MAIRSRGQVSITDVTDGYSVIITTEAFIFQGDASTPTALKSTQTFSTVISGWCGYRAVSTYVDVSELTLPTGLSVTSDDDPIAPTLTFTATTALTTATLTNVGGAITIPVVLDAGKITVNKAISLSIAATGATGDDGYMIDIESSAGEVFKNSSGSTIMTARIYQGGAELDTNGTTFNYKWTKYNKDGTKVPSFNQTTKSITVTANDVNEKATFYVEVTW